MGAIVIRPAREDDSREVWRINGHPSVRALSIRTEPIPWERHAAWYALRLRDPKTLLRVADVGDRIVGVIRTDVDPHERTWTVSVAVDVDARGRGIGQRLIAHAVREVRERDAGARILATIRKTNTGSLHSFERCGFVRVTEEELFLHFEHEQAGGVVLVVCDGTPATGAGHAIRCMALAHELRRLGWSCVFSGAWSVPFLRTAAAREGWELREIALKGSPPLKDVAAVVVDHYGWSDADLKGLVSAAGPVVMALDDEGKRQMPVDIVVNQNPLSAARYRPAPGGEVLQGQEYLLLRPEIAHAARMRRANGWRPGYVKNVVCVPGGTDLGRVGMALAVAARTALPGVSISLVTDDRVEEEGVERVARTPDLLQTLEQADLVLAAAGTVCWEVCALGIPLMAVQVAENQAVVVNALAQGRCGLVLPAEDRSRWPAIIARAVRDSEALTAMAARGMRCVDGSGASRIAYALHRRIADRKRRGPGDAVG